jgi:hypothetical protein
VRVCVGWRAKQWRHNSTRDVTRHMRACWTLSRLGLLNDLRFIDIGGGFKVPYEPGEKPIPLPELVSCGV